MKIQQNTHDVHHKKKPTFQRQQSTFPYINQRTGHPKQQKIARTMVYTSNPTKSYPLIKHDLYVAGDNFEQQWKNTKKCANRLFKNSQKREEEEEEGEGLLELEEDGGEVGGAEGGEEEADVGSNGGGEEEHGR